MPTADQFLPAELKPLIGRFKPSYRLGNTPLEQAEVVGVRQGQTYSMIDAGAPLIGSSHNYTTVADRIVYVDVK